MTPAKWVMYGRELPTGGVTVWASKTIHDEVHFRERETLHLDSMTYRPVGYTASGVDFAGAAGNAIEADAPTFAEAIADILRQWGGVINDPFSALGGPQPEAIEGRVIDG